MPGTYPDYLPNTQDTQYDIPGRTDIANAADYNDHDREILKHQDLLKNHEGRIVVLESGGAVTYLKDLLDVNAPTPTGWQCLSYDSTTSKWINRTINEGSTGPQGPQGPQGPAGTGGGGSPSGVDTNIQFNDEGAFGGSDGLTWDKNMYRLGTNMIWASGTLHVDLGIHSTVASGTQPYECTSPTRNVNLNADLLDGYHCTDFLMSVSGFTDTLQSVTDRGNSTDNDIYIGASGILQNISTKSITASGNIYAVSGDIKMDDLRALRYGATKLLYGDTSWRNYFYGNAGNTYMASPGCIGIGNAALSKNIDGWYNTAIGDDALELNTEGAYNVAIGPGVLSVNTTGNSNVAIGWVSMNENTIGGGNTAIGPYTLCKNVDGNNNTAIGGSALFANTGGDNNTAIGGYTLGDNLTGDYNCAIGEFALQFNTTGTRNLGIGFSALRSNKTGSYNTAIGLSAGYTNLYGSNNVYIGNTAGLYEYRDSVSTLYIDNRQHSTFEQGKSCAIIYGNFGPNAADIVGQELFLNANTYIQASGVFNNISSKSITASGNIEVIGDKFRIDFPYTPSASSSPGASGTITWDSSYIYVCVADNTWKRTALDSW
jgi:hypothetical protein